MIILHHDQQRTQKFQTKYHQRSTIMKWERESAGLTGCISALFLSSSILAGLRLRPKSLTMSEWRTVSDILLVKKDPKCNNVTLKMSANLSFVELKHTPRKTERVSNTYTFEKQWDINVTVALTQSRFRELRKHIGNCNDESEKQKWYTTSLVVNPATTSYLFKIVCFRHRKFKISQHFSAELLIEQ